MLEESVGFLRQVDAFDFSSISNQGSNKETHTVVPMLTPSNPLQHCGAIATECNRGFFCAVATCAAERRGKKPVDSDEVQRSCENSYDESKAE